MIGQDIIRLKDVLELMDSGPDPFSISFVTANRSKGTGGEIVRLTNCLKTGTRVGDGKGDIPPASAQVPGNTPTGRNPNHFDNGTRNLTLVGSNQIRKCHIWLILEFNGKKVII